MIDNFPTGPLITRVPFFLIFSADKGALKQEAQMSTTGEPS